MELPSKARRNMPGYLLAACLGSTGRDKHKGLLTASCFLNLVAELACKLVNAALVLRDGMGS